jgi:hypothetical protein
MKIYIHLFLILLFLFSSVSFADTCPASMNQVNTQHWKNEFAGRSPDFNNFSGAVYRNGKIFCAYKDIQRPTRLAVVSKYGYSKPAYGFGQLWRRHPQGVICTQKINICTFK